MELTGGNVPFWSREFLKGARDYVISYDKKEPSVNLIHFNHANLSGGNISVQTFNGVTSSKYDFNDEKKHRYKNYTDASLYNSATYEYNTSELLPVDGGHGDWQMSSKYRLDFQGNENEIHDMGETVHDHFLIYAGNTGTMMFRSESDSTTFNSSTEFTRYVTLYNTNHLMAKNYLSSEQFTRNMRALLSQSDNLVIECEVKGFYPYPDEIISFTGAPIPFNSAFEILSVEADFGSDTTKYKLRKRNG